MALSTYSELKTQVSLWLDSQSQKVLVPDFISLFEATANRRLRVRQQETSSTFTVADGEISVTGAITLPTNYLAWRSVVSCNTSGCWPLDYLNPDSFIGTYGSQDTGSPRAFKIDADGLVVRPVPTTESVILFYYAKIPVLSVSNPTNWLLTAHPDLYLFGSLVEAEMFGGNDQRMPLWKARRDEIFAEIETLANRTRGIGQIQVDFPTP